MIHAVHYTTNSIRPAVGTANSQVAKHVARLSVLERLCLLIGIVEIPLQLDKYFMFHERDAALGAVAGFNVSVTTLALAVLYWVWLTKATTARGNLWDRFNFGGPMLFYLTAVGVSVFSATLPMLSLFDLFLLGQSYLLFIFLANRIRFREDLYFCFACLSATLLLQSFFIIGLYAMGDAAVGKMFELGPIILSVWVDGRPTGSMQSAVLAGSTLAIMWLPVSSLTLSRVDSLTKLICFAGMVLGLLAIMLTQTRGAILSSLLGASALGAGLYLRGELPKWAITMALALAVFCAYPMYRVVKNRIQGDDSGSAQARIHLSAIAFEMIGQRPITGYGAGNCHIVGQRFADQAKYRSEWYYTIHCKYLLVWIETGLMGLAAFLCVLGTGVLNGIKVWRLRDRDLAHIGLALTAALLGHMLHMFVDIFNSRTQVQMLWVILGLSAATLRMPTDSLAPSSVLQFAGGSKSVR